MWCYRIMVKNPWIDRVTNKVLNEIEEKPVEYTMQEKKRMGWTPYATRQLY